MIHRTGPAARRAAILAAAWMALAAAPAESKTCTRELTEREFAGREIPEVVCEGISVRLMPLQSEMFYRRWSGEMVVRTAGREGPAKIALAAFDAAGDLIGTASLYPRKVDRKPKRIPLRMDGMFTSLADTRRILLSVSMPSGKAP
jgi:hypothetical protein